MAHRSGKATADVRDPRVILALAHDDEARHRALVEELAVLLEVGLDVLRVAHLLPLTLGTP